MSKQNKSFFGSLISFEHRKQPLIGNKRFLVRIIRNLLYTMLFLMICLGIGVVGYKYTGPMSWIDALHNASMILSGMGPVVEIKTNVGKVFSSCYALFSGVAFITNIGILIAPIAHRFYHSLHLEAE